MLVMFSLSIPLSYAGKSDKRQGNRQYKQIQRWNDEHHPRHHNSGHKYKRYTKNWNNKYREHKYKRHYKWNKWNRERHHPRYRNGKYHHDDNGYMMFSFCNQERGDKVCFSISID